MILYPPFLTHGVAIAPWLILIPQWAKSDPAYLVHGQTHAAQQRRGGTLAFWWLYLTNKSFKQSAEVEAYKAQIKAGATWSYCASQLATGYGLGIDYLTAVKLLEPTE